MENAELAKSQVFKIVDILEYIPHSVATRSIIRKITGHVNVISFDADEVLTAKVSPFDRFIQIIDGKAEIIIDGKSNLLKTGQAIIIPAHSSNTIKANVKFKMLSTIIKSGYEEVSL